MTTPIQHRATELVEKSGMPWHEAESLALTEFGITDADVEELKGNCCNTTILTGEDILALIRSVLVHGSALLARNSEDAMTSSAYIDGLESRTHEMKKKIDALDFDLRTARLASASKPKQDVVVKPEGFEVTPIEPTDEMYEAGYNVLREIHAGPFGGSPSLGHAGKVFRAMLEANKRMKLSTKDGLALVPLRMNRAMQDVVAQDEWEWADVLVAANSVTEEQYNEALS